MNAKSRIISETGVRVFSLSFFQIGFFFPELKFLSFHLWLIFYFTLWDKIAYIVVPETWFKKITILLSLVLFKRKVNEIGKSSVLERNDQEDERNPSKQRNIRKEKRNTWNTGE